MIEVGSMTQFQENQSMATHETIEEEEETLFVNGMVTVGAV